MTQTKGEKLLLTPVNYLAHILLSGNDPLLLVGNFMGDGVKGSHLEHLHPRIKQGVILHRAIDSYTDEHELAVIGRERLREKSGKYAGVVLDMFYDHILSKDWSDYHESTLADFVAEKYQVLTDNIELMPPRIQRMLPHMVAGDWLGGYAEIEGLSNALQGISRRASNGHLIQGAESVISAHYDLYKSEFNSLFSDVKHMCDELVSAFET